MQPEKKEARTGSQPVPSLAETLMIKHPFLTHRHDRDKLSTRNFQQKF